MKYLPVILLVGIGSWLIAAPFVLGYTQIQSAMHNDVGIGVLMLIGALIWGFSELATHGLKSELSIQRR